MSSGLFRLFDAWDSLEKVFIWEKIVIDGSWSNLHIRIFLYLDFLY